MARKAPFGIVTSPCRMYGLPAVVHVWLMTFPPLMIVSAAAGIASAIPTKTVASAPVSADRRLDMAPPGGAESILTARRALVVSRALVPAVMSGTPGHGRRLPSLKVDTIGRALLPL